MAGMTVRTEHQVHVMSPGGVRRSGEIDICWFHPSSGRLLVVWEIDGQDARGAHIVGGGSKDLAGNKAKLDVCKADLKIQVLYSLKNDISPKGRSKLRQIIDWLPGVEVVMDEELMALGPMGIDHWMQCASILLP